MINWAVNVGQEVIEKPGWYFATFHVQEYLLPMINISRRYIDEYGNEKFSKEDCLRIKANIEYMWDAGIFDKKDEIRYESRYDNLVVLSSKQIQDSLMSLYEATEIAILQEGVLNFYGD